MGDSDGGVGGFDNSDTSGKTTINEGTSRDYMSKETREESR